MAEVNTFTQVGDTITRILPMSQNGAIGGRIGAGTITVIVEVSYDDGANWETKTVTKSDGTTTAAPAAGAGFWADVAGVTQVRLRCTAFTNQTQPNRLYFRAG